MQTIWQDARYGLRGLLKRPGFSILAIVTLALGIGATTTIFSVIQNVLLDPVPYVNADRVAMIQIHDTSSSRPGGRSAFQTPEYLDYQEQNHVFEEVIGGGRSHVLRMVAAMGLRLVALGVTIGLVATFGVTRLVASQIWGVSPHDPLTLAIVVSVMALVVIMACYIPARRATRVDPMVALRWE